MASQRTGACEKGTFKTARKHVAFAQSLSIAHHFAQNTCSAQFWHCRAGTLSESACFASHSMTVCPALDECVQQQGFKDVNCTLSLLTIQDKANFYGDEG
eukprot:2611918-Amphidinium_carterae.1